VVEVVEGEGVSRIRAVQEVVEVEGEVEAAEFAHAIGVEGEILRAFQVVIEAEESKAPLYGEL
jgi:hypothetical protein